MCRVDWRITRTHSAVELTAQQMRVQILRSDLCTGGRDRCGIKGDNLIINAVYGVRWIRRAQDWSVYYDILMLPVLMTQRDIETCFEVFSTLSVRRGIFRFVEPASLYLPTIEYFELNSNSFSDFIVILWYH